MTEISQFHKLARLVKRMDKEVSISSDAIVALSEEIAELEALAADRLEMNKELEAAALKVLRTSLDRLELLKKIVEESFLDVENQTWYWSCSQIEFDEMTKELG